MKSMYITVKEVLSAPVKNVDDENCYWSVLVRLEWYGSDDVKTIRRYSKSEIDKIIPGHRIINF